MKKKLTRPARPAKRTTPAKVDAKKLDALAAAANAKATADGRFQNALTASLLKLASLVMHDDAAESAERLLAGPLVKAVDDAIATLLAQRTRTKTLAGIPAAAVVAVADQMRKARDTEELQRSLREKLALAMQ